MSAGQRRTEQAELTRAALVDAARELFVEKGYFDTGTEEVVARAGVGTRGALYHHFADKKDLFRAVFDAVQADLAAASAARPRRDAFTTLSVSLLQFLEAAATNADVQRIVLVDGPAVLGWETWRELEASYGLGAISSLLEAAIAEGTIDRQPVAPLAHMLLAAVDEAALYVAAAPNQRAAQRETQASFKRLLDGLRSR
ncbi:MAG: TetR/AcrR family transcriptional regulator [Acidimicrobiia bacterium]